MFSPLTSTTHLQPESGLLLVTAIGWRTISAYDPADDRDVIAQAVAYFELDELADPTRPDLSKAEWFFD